MSILSSVTRIWPCKGKPSEAVTNPPLLLLDSCVVTERGGTSSRRPRVGIDVGLSVESQDEARAFLRRRDSSISKFLRLVVLASRSTARKKSDELRTCYFIMQPRCQGISFSYRTIGRFEQKFLLYYDYRGSKLSKPGSFSNLTHCGA